MREKPRKVRDVRELARAREPRREDELATRDAADTCSRDASGRTSARPGLVSLFPPLSTAFFSR